PGLEHPRADEAADAVVHRVPGERRENQQAEHGRQAQLTGRAQRPRRKQERIAGQKGGHHEAGLREDDREQDRVHPRPVVADELEQVLVEVEDEIDEAHQTASSARPRSSSRSSISSMPAEMRTRPSVIPISWRRSAGTEEWVIDAGCEMSVSTPPRLSASACSFTVFRSRRAASSEPRSNASMPPNPRIWRFARSYCGWVGKPG